MDFLTNQNIIFYILAYLFGSIPFGLILAKIFAGVNVKESGSKSIGATNVLRVVKEKDPKLAKKLGLATVILDAIKVTITLLIAISFNVSQETLWMIAVLGVLGHCYSIFLGFEGGKGVATGLGAYIVLIPYATIIGAIVWAFCAKVLKISSLSSLIALIAVLVSANFIYDGLNVGSNVPMYLIAFIVFYKHIPNIIRLVKGEEKKVV
ncbi:MULTISPECIES: glycerol-3-phosphate 1-O-acyltransferase PlsY [Aliarcobacter]|uniref:glycerol-3-phosphate 1-O-acyltransferase PlsY n=1 Tax=Aliarcobacter TaxID=2321111 RepID=UPI00242EFE83|nr:glycerol-3-phosphate 1-O-acyltransferase PlsY [Aliarcobacter skirrowii]MDD2507751.1 glycerol-3-phosphate 1-O-acyltransferase PlsY [Aliarcobacter skirrowii]MDD3496103.1 glycerol-3-phosphate 1-O-acyltransferase PlsY [Aliarcobacter skirrowii]